MNRYQSYLRGYYSPSFFKMGISVIEPLDNPENLPELPKSTFFHEYIHFLQDISTTYGLINTCIVVTKMKFANHYILNSIGNKFKVPITFTADPITEINSKLQEVYLGYPSPSINHLIIADVRKEATSVFLPAPFNKFITTVKIYHADSLGGTASFSFGSLHIMETMCHIAQQVYSPGITHADVPYKTAQLVAQYIYDIISSVPLNVFALCEASMMHSYPADCFFEMLIQMKVEHFVPETELEIYDFVFRNIHENGSGRTLLQIFETQIDLTINELSSYFTTGNFSIEKQWITHLLNEAMKIRLENPAFILSLLKQTELYSDELKRIMLLLGTPLMQNLDGECWFQKPLALRHLEISPDRLAAILEIHDLWMSGKKGCELKRFCTRSLIGSTTDERCDNAPWTRCNNNEPLCSFAQFWKTWKLIGKEPQFY